MNMESENPYRSPNPLPRGNRTLGSEAAVEMPLWVEYGLWGLPTPEAILPYFWSCLIIGSSCIAFGFLAPPVFCGGFLLFSAWWDYAALRWMHENESW